MSDNSSEEEPSIEEILASIRQIISDDDEVEEKETLESPVRDRTNDVLALTEDDLAEQDDPEEEPEPYLNEDPDIELRDPEEEAPAPYVPPEPEPEPEVFTQPEPEPAAPARPVPSDILSSSAQAAAMGSLAKLTKRMPINSSRSYDGVTLEDIVRETLNPMLREWMDDNLPNMVERIVQKELEKLARRAFDD